MALRAASLSERRLGSSTMNDVAPGTVVFTYTDALPRQGPLPQGTVLRAKPLRSAKSLNRAGFDTVVWASVKFHDWCHHTATFGWMALMKLEIT